MFKLILAGLMLNSGTLTLNPSVPTKASSAAEASLIAACAQTATRLDSALPGEHFTCQGYMSSVADRGNAAIALVESKKTTLIVLFVRHGDTWLNVDAFE